MVAESVAQSATTVVQAGTKDLTSKVMLELLIMLVECFSTLWGLQERRFAAVFEIIRMLMWEDGFCRGRIAECLEEMDGEDPVKKKAFSHCPHDEQPEKVNSIIREWVVTIERESVSVNTEQKK